MLCDSKLSPKSPENNEEKKQDDPIKVWLASAKLAHLYNACMTAGWDDMYVDYLVRNTQQHNHCNIMSSFICLLNTIH